MNPDREFDDYIYSMIAMGSQSFTRLTELSGWDVAELWTDANRLFAVFGLVAAEAVQGS